MHPWFQLLIFLLALTPAQAASPSHICSAIVSGIESYNRYLSDQAQTSDVVAELHDFGWNLPQKNGPSVATSMSLSNKSGDSAISKMLGQISGIEKNHREPVSADPNKETIVAAIKLVSNKKVNVKVFDETLNAVVPKEIEVNEIAEFSNKVASSLKLIQETTSLKDSAVMNLQKSMLAVGVTGALLFGYLAHLSDLKWEKAVATGFGSIIFSSDSLGMLRYYLRRDNIFDKVQKRTEDLFDNGKPNDWIYDSWSYNPSQQLVDGLIREGLDKTPEQQYYQEVADSKGLMGMLTAIPEVKKAKSEKAWVGIDRLVRKDENGELVMYLVVRTKRTKPDWNIGKPRDGDDDGIRKFKEERDFVPAYESAQH